MALNKIKVCVIEDEKIAMNALTNSINNSKELELISQADSVDEAVESIVSTNPDLIFLDIKLIGGDAFDVLNKLISYGHEIPPIVINTGYHEFEYGQLVFNEYKDLVIVILKKPFWEDWEDNEKLILKKYYEAIYKSQADIKKDRILLKTRYKTFVIRINDIQILRILGDKKGKGKTKILTKNRDYLINRSLSSLEDELPRHFIRINRYEIINGRNIYEYDHSDQVLFLYDINTGLDVGNTYKENFNKFLDTL